jgi:hypothetical protein
MNRLFLRLIPAVALAIVAAPLFAQQPGPRGGGGAITTTALLTNKGVVEELKLSDEQQEKVKKSLTEIREKFAEDLKGSFKDKEKFAKIQKDMAAEVTKNVMPTLKAEQVKRLHQIEIQAGVQTRGPSAFLTEAVEKEMKFTDKQKDAIKEAGEALAKERMEIFKEIGKDKDKRAEAQKTLATKTKAAVEKITSTLTEDQKKAYKELTGAAFEYKPEMRARPTL